MRAFIAFIVAAGLACSACSKKEPPAVEGAKPAEGEQAKGGGDKIGVQECDDYLTKLEACLKNMPEAGRPAMEQAMQQNRDTWKEMAKEPTTKAGLSTACKTALDALAQNPACK
ncbi:MAG: hypothetical protein JW751_17740 [Polyangiaceae bacterium]|nr:hypothetical protein [Polyangiaceae bacterium]